MWVTYWIHIVMGEGPPDEILFYTYLLFVFFISVVDAILNPTVTMSLLMDLRFHHHKFPVSTSEISDLIRI